MYSLFFFFSFSLSTFAYVLCVCLSHSLTPLLLSLHAFQVFQMCWGDETKKKHRKQLAVHFFSTAHLFSFPFRTFYSSNFILPFWLHFFCYSVSHLLTLHVFLPLQCTLFVLSQPFFTFYSHRTYNSSALVYAFNLTFNGIHDWSNDQWQEQSHLLALFLFRIFFFFFVEKLIQIAESESLQTQTNIEHITFIKLICFSKSSNADDAVHRL